MANIRVDLVEEIVDGQSVTFKAPCDCTVLTGLKLYYPTENGIANKLFTLKDAHGKNLTGIGDLFVKDAYVKVVLNTGDSTAYLQNADTNSYLEGRFNSLTSALADGQLKFRIVDGDLEYSVYTEEAATVEEV
jgi:hypothetical protein